MDQSELISIRNGDKTAYAELLKQFDPLIKSEVAECTRRLPEGSEFDVEDLTQEAMLALYKAALSYVPDKSVTFGLYAKICIHNCLISCARKISAQHRKRMREEKRKIFREPGEQSAEERFLAQARTEDVEKLLEQETSALERRIFSLYLEKKSYAEISEIAERDVKSVGNAIYRVKRKLRKLLMK